MGPACDGTDVCENRRHQTLSPPEGQRGGARKRAPTGPGPCWHLTLDSAVKNELLSHAVHGVCHGSVSEGTESYLQIKTAAAEDAWVSMSSSIFTGEPTWTQGAAITKGGRERRVRMTDGQRSPFSGTRSVDFAPLSTRSGSPPPPTPMECAGSASSELITLLFRKANRPDVGPH